MITIVNFLSFNFIMILDSFLESHVLIFATTESRTMEEGVGPLDLGCLIFNIKNGFNLCSLA